MKLLVIGASGLVGWNLWQEAEKAGHEVVGTCHAHPQEGLTPVDLGDAGAIAKLVDDVCPNAMVNCAAWSWVDGCERDPEKAFRCNKDQPAMLAGLAVGLGIPFVHFSSSYVFDGVEGPYSEEDEPNPINVYGKSKLAGEQAVLEATSGKAVIARTMGVYGLEPQGKNFVYQVVGKLRMGEAIRVPNDQYGNASHAADLAEWVLALLDRKASGVWNLAGENSELRRDVLAVQIAEVFGLDAGLVQPVGSELLGQEARRPCRAGLFTRKIFSLLPGLPTKDVDALSGLKESGL